ncbi:SGNH/GDSL hydrolase family protein [Nocardioides sp. KR10-350]
MRPTVRRTTRPALLVALIVLATLAATLSVTLFVTPTSGASSSYAPPAKKFAVLALGDSYSSGEGLQDHDGTRCARSPSAYAFVAARDPLLHDYTGPGNVQFLACSGAQSRSVTASEDLPEQIARAVRQGRKYGLITLTIGGNDIGFADVLQGCIKKTYTWFPREKIGCPFTEQQLNARVARLKNRLINTYGTITRQLLAPGGHLAVLGYPSLFEDPARWTQPERAMARCALVRAADVRMLRRVGDRLNATIRAATAPLRDVEFVNVASGFEGHNLCSPDEWINGLHDIVSRGPHHGRIMTAFHPNEAGHQWEGHQLAKAVRLFDWSRYGRKVDAGKPDEICLDPSQKRVCVHTDLLSGSIDFYGMGHGPYAQPSAMYVGSNLVFNKLKWTHWGENVATAYGQTLSNDCQPSCSESTTPVRKRIQIEVSRIATPSRSGAIGGILEYTCARVREVGKAWGSLGPGLDRPVCVLP